MTDYIDIDGLGHYDGLIKDYIDAHAGGGTRNVFYGTSSTAAGTQAKVVECADFTAADLKAGTVLFVLMGNAQTYNGAASLNVNGTGAVLTRSVSGTANYRYCWYKNEVVCFVHDGSYWVQEDAYRADTTYYGVTKLSSAVNSTSNSLAATPGAVKQAYDLAAAALPGYESAANANLCSQSSADWEQGGISATGGNLSRTHTIRLAASARMAVTGGVPYLFDIQDGYTVNVKPYTSAGTFYEDPNLASEHIQNYPFVWVPTQDGYLRLTCTIDGSTALAPEGIETALPVVRVASAADLAAVLYNVELFSGYATGSSASGAASLTGMDESM